MALAVVSACLVSVGSASVGAPRGGVSLVTPQQGTRSQHGVPWRAGLAHLAEPRLSGFPLPRSSFLPFPRCPIWKAGTRHRHTPGGRYGPPL